MSRQEKNFCDVNTEDVLLFYKSKSCTSKRMACNHLCITGVKRLSERKLMDSGAPGFLWPLVATNFHVTRVNQKQISVRKVLE